MFSKFCFWAGGGGGGGAATTLLSEDPSVFFLPGVTLYFTFELTLCVNTDVLFRLPTLIWELGEITGDDFSSDGGLDGVLTFGGRGEVVDGDRAGLVEQLSPDAAAVEVVTSSLAALFPVVA